MGGVLWIGDDLGHACRETVCDLITPMAANYQQGPGCGKRTHDSLNDSSTPPR